MEEIQSTDSPEVIEWRKEQEVIRLGKKARQEATMRKLKKRLKAGEITKMEYQVRELQSLIG